jgi:hypothetical protein
MGGPGVERSYIEDAVVKNKMPMDSIVVKMSAEEAIQPLRMSMINAFQNVMKSLDRSISRTKKGDKIIIVGVGNTSGVGNNKKDSDDVVNLVKKHEKMLAKTKKKD